MLMSAYGTKRTCQSCRSMSAFGGKADMSQRHYRECRFLLVQARSSDPYQSAFARAGLLRLHQRLFDEMRRPPPVGPAPAYPGGPPAFECQTYGDEMGGGITRCY